MDKDLLWKKTLDELGVDMPEMTFQMFFKRTTAQELNENTLTIWCPNDGVCFVLQNKYYDVVFNTLQKYSPIPITKIVYVSGHQNTRNAGVRPAELFTNIGPGAEDKIRAAGLNSRFTFESFAVSVSNQLAHAALLAVSQNPGKTYNPLFLWGGVGVGKTHLIQALGRKVIETTGQTVLYCTMEDFTNNLVEAIKNKSTALFRKKYRACDVLLIDDIQFVSEREFIQEELFYTFNKLQAAGKQVIFTSDKPPRAIKKIEDRLISRFLSGLVIDIQQPDFELKTAILLLKGRERGLSLDAETARLVAAHIEELRELEGFLLRLVALKESGVIITKDAVERTLLQNGLPLIKRNDPRDILRVVCKEMGASLKEVREEGRQKKVALARHVAMYFLKTLTSLTYEEVARIVGKKDHTTVMHGVQKVINAAPTSEALRHSLERVRAYFSS